MPRFPRDDRFLLPLVLAALTVVVYWPVFSSSNLPGGEMSDTVHQGYPFFTYTIEALRDGRLPHWNPYVYCGIPFYSSFSAPVFYPLRGLPMIVAGAEIAIRFTFPLHMFLGGLFAWLFLGSIGAGRAGRYFGAIAFAAGCWANTLFYAGHGSKMICWSYIPLLLYACERWHTTRRPWFVGLGALCFGMQALSSHPQMVLYSAIAAALWLLCRGLSGRKPLRPLASNAMGLCGMLLLGTAVGAVQLLPGYNFSKLSTRGADLSEDQASSYSLPPEESLVMVFPHLFGYRHGFADSQIANLPVYWGRLGLRLSSEFVGVSVAMLALLGLIRSKSAARWPLIVLFAAGLGISWGGYSPLYRILYAVLPVFRKLRAPHMAAVLTTTAIPLAAALGLDSLLRAGRGTWKWIAAAAGIALAVSLLLAPSIVSASRSRTPAGAPFQAVAAVMEERAALARGDFLHAAGVMGLLAAGAWLAARRPSSRAIVAVGACAIAAIELVPVDRDFQVFLPQTRMQDIFPDRSDLAAMAGGGRVLPGSNDYVPSGIRSVTGYHAARPQVVDGMLQSLSSGGLQAARLTSWTVLEDSVPLLYGDVRAAILTQYVAAGLSPDSAAMMIPESPLPRVFLARSWVPASEERMLSAIGVGYDPVQISSVSEDPGIAPVSRLFRGSAELVTDLPESVTVAVTATEPALLVLADTWYPRWRVFIDGSPAALLRANYWQRAVAVPAGEHTVAFVFDSSDVGIGLWISIAASALIAAVGLAGLARRKKTAQ
jgi:hypothetical protein